MSGIFNGLMNTENLSQISHSIVINICIFMCLDPNIKFTIILLTLKTYGFRVQTLIYHHVLRAILHLNYSQTVPFMYEASLTHSQIVLIN